MGEKWSDYFVCDECYDFTLYFVQCDVLFFYENALPKLYLYANAIATLKLGTKNSSWKSSSCCNNMWLRPPRLKDIKTTPFG